MSLREQECQYYWPEVPVPRHSELFYCYQKGKGPRGADYSVEGDIGKQSEIDLCEFAKKNYELIKESYLA
jgi:hypothetical protein